MIRLFSVFILLSANAPAMAQEHHRRHDPSPYAGSPQHATKALSDQQIADYRAGRGMGLALPAELNGYPGPLHVLELSEQLQLTSDQRQLIRTLYEQMKMEAISLGQKIIAHEEELDREFADRKVTASSLASLTSDIGAIQGELRAVHLKYHLVTAELPTSEQARMYVELRGYR